jgi:hypothetical protein
MHRGQQTDGSVRLVRRSLSYDHNGVVVMMVVMVMSMVLSKCRTRYAQHHKSEQQCNQ